jgi:putative (di)nucleoside polyphosphate hydrolase
LIDAEGYRKNVGMIIINDDNQVLWAQRLGQKSAWQFPQGGIDGDESPQQALFREMKEELGIDQENVTLLAETKGWLKYDIPKNFLRRYEKPICYGQKQKWFLLKLMSDESAICIDAVEDPEFAQWRWVDYWYPIDHVIAFKRDVYEKALKELAAGIPNHT